MDESSCKDQSKENDTKENYKESKSFDGSDNEKPSKSEFAVKLDEIGLTSRFWLPVFRNELGIDCIRQLQYLKESDIKKIFKNTTQDWEKDALRGLLKDKPDYSKRLSEVIKEAKEGCKTFASNREKATKSLEQLRSLLSVPEVQWESQMKKIDLTQILQSLEFQSSKVETCISRSNKQDMEVISCASGGRVLTGVFVTDDINDLITPRSSVIQLTSDIELKSMYQQIDESTDLFSQEMSSNFHRGIEVCGVGLSGYANMSSARIGGMFSTENQTDQTETKRTHHSFYSRVKYSTISLASCELTFEHVRLVPDVEKELNFIETLISLFCREEYIIYECQKFYKKYGSHINLGVLHFGGIYQWVASHSSESVCEIKNTKDIVQTCLNSYITAYIPIKNIGAEVTASYLRTKGDVKRAYSEADLSHTTLKVIRIGGPIEIDEFYMWKYKLTSCNSTWSLINRGDLFGISEVVEHYSSNFENSLELSNILKISLVTKLKRSDFPDDKRLATKLISLFKNIKDFNKTSNFSFLECNQLLEEAVCCKKIKIKIDGTDSKWIDLLTAKHTFRDCFSKIMTQSQSSNQIEIAEMKYLIRQIVHPHTDKRFCRWIDISKWINLPDDYGDINDMKIDSVNSIQELLSSLNTTVLSNASNCQVGSFVEERITCRTAILCNLCYSSLKRSDDSFSIVLLNIGLLKSYYDEKESYFLVYLTHEKLKIFVQEMENYIKESEKYKQLSFSQMQAYITVTIIKNLKERGLTDKSEDEFDKCLSPVRNKLNDMVLSVILRNRNEGYFKWDSLEHDLTCLQIGEIVCQPKCSVSGINLDSEETMEDDACPFGPGHLITGHLHTLLENLGLTQFYPNKVKLSDVLKLTLVNSECNIKDLPWLFLQNIVMSNCHSRDKLIKTHLDNISGSKQTSANDWNCDDEDVEIDSTSTDTDIFPNPLDLLAVIYMCSEPILQQTISSNLFSCRQAVPFILPQAIYSESNLKLLIWPLRAITLEWRHKNCLVKDTAMDCPCHVVSFIRFDKTTVSKSKVINSVLSDQKGDIYDTFFNVDCSLGTTKRYVSEGMIEAAWHIPKSTSATTSLYLNLRGNGINNPIQRQFLSDISSVVVITLNIKHLLRVDSQNILMSIYQSAQSVVLAIDGMSKTDKEIKNIIRNYKKAIGVFTGKLRIIKLACGDNSLSLSDIGTCALDEISLFTSTMERKCLTDRLNISKLNKIYSDELLSKLHTVALKYCSKLMNLFPKENTNLKTTMVPLQGQPWQKLSSDLKIQQATTRYTSQKDKFQLKQEISKRRSEQLLIINNQHIFIKTFVSCLSATTHSTALCTLFLAILRQDLDKISRRVLPDFQNDIRQAWKEFNLNQNKANVNFLTQNVKRCEQSLFEASFGFEHLIREIGQMYEALTEPGLQSNIDDASKSIAKRLPKICAKLLLMGQSFELMDGDAANVPLRWIKSVLCEVTAEVGNKTILTVSVIGIQSSGKSTLINTVFGLQFPVSAGRCTRGIFMQLIKTDSAKFEFDYVLVLDTEGLRAPDLSDCNYDNDNKLATFVIGLGDIALINIKGENLTEMRNVLEIVILAFLRLRQAQTHEKKIKLRQHCIFVHQNVSSSNAVQELFAARQEDVKHLNIVTQEVAAHEGITDTNLFSQILEFDMEEDIWYFSDLWLGSPPMAPRNPEYSNACVKLKSSLLGKNVNHGTLCDFASRIDDLWKGILSDNFVFSFRNSLEVKAYNIMEQKYQEMALKLERYEFDFLHSETRTFLVECTDENSIANISTQVISKFVKGLDDKLQNLKKELNDFVEKHPLHDALETWKQKKICVLGQDQHDHIRKFRLDFNKLKEETRLEIIQRKEKINYEQEIYNLATELAHSIEKHLSAEKLEDMFNQRWTNWMTKFASRSEPEIGISVFDEIHQHVLEHYSSIALYIKQYNDDPNFGNDYTNLHQLEGSITLDVIESRHIGVKTKLKIFKGNENACKLNLMNLINSYFKTIDQQLKKTAERYRCFNIAMASEIFYTIDQMWKAHENEENAKFCIQLPFHGMIIAHVAFYMVQYFENLNEEYQIKHSSQSRLGDYKDSAMICFKGLVQTKREHVIASDIFLDKLKKIIIEHVSGCIPISVYEKLLPEFPSGKKGILIKILSHLADKSCHRTYFKYLKMPNPFVRDWLQTFIHQNILNQKDDDDISVYCQLAIDHIHPIVQLIQDTVSRTNNDAHCETAKQWLTSFVENINASKLLPLPKHQFVHVENICEFDTQEFSAMIIDKLDYLEKTIMDNFKTNDMVKWKENPVDRLMDKLWGCQEVCPFCVEPCKQTSKNHVIDDIPHACLQHRILGVAGHSEDQFVLTKFDIVSTLTLETCNDKVAQPDDTFIHAKKDILWKNYQVAFVDWQIEENMSDNSYWKWFVCQYAYYIENEYGIKLPKIPENWRMITKQMAKESLQF